MKFDKNQIGKQIEERASELEDTTVLSTRQSQVEAAKEFGLSRKETADWLDISPNTVDQHRQIIRDRVERAMVTVEEVNIQG